MSPRDAEVLGERRYGDFPAHGCTNQFAGMARIEHLHGFSSNSKQFPRGGLKPMKYMSGFQPFAL
jgi:hypothetical protein